MASNSTLPLTKGKMTVGLFLSGMMVAVVAFSPTINTTYYVIEAEPKSLVPSNIREVLTGVLWADFLESNPVQINVRSNISCSFEAMRSGVASFTFEENACSLFGSGGTSDGQVFIYQRIPSPLDESFEEVARGKSTNSTQAYATSWTSEKAVDGLLDDANIYHSASSIKSWWWVDLGEERIIYQIQIYPRQHGSYYQRFHDVEVRVGTTPINNGDFSSYSLLCTYEKGYVYDEGHLLCARYNGVIGRYVSIQITDSAAEYLQINEVSVYALKN